MRKFVLDARFFPEIPESTNLKMNPNAENRDYNMIFHGDNFDVMKFLLSTGYEGALDLIYIDPPFFSGSTYNFKNIKGFQAYDDRWKNDFPFYLKYLEKRIKMMRRLLKDTGSIYVHLDWRASHHVRVMMDRIFGTCNFRNEIVWHYFMGGKSRKVFARKHDLILFYSKSSEWKFHPQKVKRRIDYLPKLPMRSSSGKSLQNTYYKDVSGWYSIVSADDVWDIHGVFNLSSEYSGFPTQKPVELLRRIVLSSSDPGDLVGDFFMGSGTTLIVSSAMGRKFIGCDASAIAVSTTLGRFFKSNIQEKKPGASHNCGVPLYLYKRNEDSRRIRRAFFDHHEEITLTEIPQENTSSPYGNTKGQIRQGENFIMVRGQGNKRFVYSDLLLFSESTGLPSIPLSLDQHGNLILSLSPPENTVFLVPDHFVRGEADIQKKINALELKRLEERVIRKNHMLEISALDVKDFNTGLSMALDHVFLGVCGRDMVPSFYLMWYPPSKSLPSEIYLDGLTDHEWIVQRMVFGPRYFDVYIQNTIHQDNLI